METRVQAGDAVAFVRPELALKLGVPGGTAERFDSDRKRWVVLLSAGRRVLVRACNLQTKDSMADEDAVMRNLGPPTANNTLIFSSAMEFFVGPQGRGWRARADIPSHVYLYDPHMRVLEMSGRELDELQVEFEEFHATTLAFGFEYPDEEFPITLDPAAHVGVLLGELPKDAMLRYLMEFDPLANIDELMSHVTVLSMVWLAFWLAKLPDVPRQHVFKMWAFLRAYAYMHKHRIVFGLFSLCNCPDERWRDLQCQGRGEPAQHDRHVDFGQMIVTTGWGASPLVGPTGMSTDKCVLLVRAVRGGEELQLDYGPDYVAHRATQMRHVDEPCVRDAMRAIAEMAGERVLEAFGRCVAAEGD